jgi:hypothetical protein
VSPVDKDQFGEIIRKAAEFITPGDYSDYFIKVGLSGPGGIFPGISISGGNTPSIQNVVATTAGTEYTLVLPTGTRRFTIRSRTFGTLKIGLNSGDTATNFISVSLGSVYAESDLLTLANITLYVASSKSSDTIEAIIWT